MVLSDLSSDKKLIRNDMVKKRSTLDETTALNMSRHIAELLCGSEEFIKANTIALYSSKDFEVSTTEIFNKAISLGKKVYYPKTCSKTRALTFFEVLSLDDLIVGEFSITEPKGDSEED